MSTELNQPNRSGRILLFFFWLFLFLGVVFYFDSTSNYAVEEAAQYTTTEAQINTLKVALSAFNKRTGTWPTSKEGLLALVLTVPDPTTGIAKPVVKPEALIDPWESDFQYAYPAQRSKDAFELWSMGPDKRSGTEDDIGNWPASATTK